MSKLNLATISSTVNKARMEQCFHEDCDVESEFYKMLGAIHGRMDSSRLYDITISITVEDAGEAITTEEPAFYLSGEEVE